MFRTLHPTTHTKLRGAKDAQWLLSGHNRFKKRTYFGKVDGVYGEASGHAADRMRYWLGYPRYNLGGRFGAQLYQYLLPLDNPLAKKLPRLYRLRRKRRLAAEKKRLAALAKSGKAKALRDALSKVGVHEAGYSNNNEFGAWYGFNGVAWCAEFVSWAFRNHPSAKRGMKTALARQFMYWARSGTYGLRITHRPEPGDIVVYDSGQGHVGIFVSGNASWFKAVEGNTSCSGGSWDNGGEVCVQTRGREKNPVFVRVP